jgi:hypothetical protein
VLATQSINEAADAVIEGDEPKAGEWANPETLLYTFTRAKFIEMAEDGRYRYDFFHPDRSDPQVTLLPGVAL